MLTITIPADDLALLTIEQLRVAAGLADDDVTQDTALTALGLRVAAEITEACRVVVGNGGQPTLLQETVTETFRWVDRGALILSRRHNVEIVGVVVDEEILTEADFWVDAESGMLRRVSEGSEVYWRGTLLTVDYTAGFPADAIPADLAGAALDLVRLRVSEGERDPLVKGESNEVPGVLTRRTDFWVGPVPGSSSGPVPDAIAGRLSRYMNYTVG